MFIEAYAKQIGQWCGKNNLFFTGHGINEAPLSEQAACSGSLMPFYAHMQIPGIDMLTDYRNEYISPKQCSSVARQLGRKWVLSELYGCTGWDTTFATYKHIGDWQAALGITMRCPHLAWYSMAGEAKRDYPASIHFHSPWYKQYRKLEDYFARINSVLAEGTAICDVAMVNPIESFYFMWRADIPSREPDQAIKVMDQLYASLTKGVLGAHVDFDFIDEALLPEQKVNVARHDEAVLNVGDMSYKVVVVPPMLTMRKSTLELLKAFTGQGGKVIFIKDVPEYVDGKFCADAKIFALDRCIELDKSVLSDMLQESCGRISIKDEDGREIEEIFHQLRKIGGDTVLFFSSIDCSRRYEKIFIKMQDIEQQFTQVQLWDAQSGNRYVISHNKHSTVEIEFCVDMPAGGSQLIVLSQQCQELPEYVVPGGEQQKYILCDQWNYTLDDTNVLVLDRADCVLKSNGRAIVKLHGEEILVIDDKLRKMLQYPLRTGAGIQAWVDCEDTVKGKHELTLTYKFSVDELPRSGIKLAIEQPQNWEISLNDNVLSETSTGWWVDPAIKTLSVAESMLTKGINVLILTGKFSKQTDLEALYLIGNFGVKTDGMYSTINVLPDKLKLGSITEQGLPFYSGNIVYRANFYFDPKPGSQYWLNLEDIKATAAEISLNGSDATLCGMPDYTVEITELLKSGDNEIYINLLGSRRNAFGPLHMTDERPVYLSAASFRQNVWYKWQDEYKLTEYGLYKYPVICTSV
jgi:hypothetical protein